ncbi:MAG: 1-phosphofructokinase family hexose kinase [Oscillospiraceae bacterium]|jgi:1-phosphofructokinase|nr:1-phosphofructokinase family hexose kinase [Oscillospiraceae bacterium]
MIVCVTMNPALDKTAALTRLVPGTLNRLRHVRVDAGGKGVNVSGMVAVLGGASVCTGFVGGETGRELLRRLEARGLAHDFLTVAGVTRTNLKVFDGENRLTELNEPGPGVTDAEVAALLEKTRALARRGDVVVLSGSLPPGAGIDTYRLFAETLRTAGCRVIVDAEGEPFRRALEAPPHVVKPNRFELLQYGGLPSDTPNEYLPALCRSLLDKGIEWVVLSMGRDGAMFFTRQRAVWAPAPSVEVGSAVGAGDSMVGAIACALQMGLGFEETVRLAMAAALGAVTTQGTRPPARASVDKWTFQIEMRPV